MIGLRLAVPIACWRPGHAREFFETEDIPSPATCYGALLSLVGETDLEHHRGCRVSAGLVMRPARSVIVRTMWRLKSAARQGTGDNARPDLQELMIGADLIVWCDGSEEPADESLESRIVKAMQRPDRIDRFGGWSLGESST